LSSLRLLLLGLPCIERDGVPVEVDTRKAIALFAYLALTGQAHSREALAALFWPEYDQDRAYANLRRTLWSLNRAVGKEWLDVDKETIGLRRAAGFWLDVDAFRSHLPRCQTHDHAGSDVCTACIPALTAAVKVYRGDFMAGFTLRDSPDFDDWQLFQARALRDELARALARLVRCHAARGEFDSAIPHARRWVALDPLHEPAHRELIKLHVWAGQRTAALRQYQDCVRVLEQELGVPPDEETVKLCEAIQANQPPPPPETAILFKKISVGVRPPPAPRHNLPPQPTPFIGREEMLADIAALLQDPDCRLLTLVGPGGIGKTRLALQAASEQLDAFLYGVWFVPLAPLSSPEFIVPTMADALRFSFFQREGEEPKQQLINYLREKQMLLVLDNFDHLVEGAGLLSEVLASAPQVKILVTSRQRLNLQAEWALEIEGMHYPADGQVASPEGYSAMQLFLERARRADVGFSLSEDQIPDLVRICRLVQGMPLGIELAAAWVKMLSCREIAHQIERSLDFLATSMRDMPQRHRSLRAVFDHSWQLLSEAERSAFSKLSVFRGGFRREAAAQVAGADLPLLSGLVDKSLLRQQPSGRHEMHELLRQYAAERLDRLPQAMEDARDLHCGHFVTFLQQREGDLKGARQKQAVEEVRAEIGNVRAAWRWATEQGRVLEIGQGAESLYRFYQIRSLPREGEEAFAQAVAALEAQACPAAERRADLDLVLGMALAFQGFFACEFYLIDKGHALFRRSLALLRPLGPHKDLALAIALSVYKELALAVALGVYEDAVEDITEAEQLLHESLTIHQEAGDRWGMAFSLALLGLRASLRGDHAAAERFLRESLAIRSEIGDRWGMARSLFDLGRIAERHLGAHEEAKRLYQESLVLYRELGDRYAQHLSLDYTGYVARELGEYEQARQLHQQSLAVSREIGDSLGIAGSLGNLGLVARDLGDYEEATAYCQEALAIRLEVGHQFSTAVSHEHWGDLALALGDYEAAKRHFNSSLEVYEGHGYWGFVTPRRGLGQVYTALGDMEQAQEHYYTALKAATEAAHVSLILEVLACMAQLAAKTGQNETAVELLAYVAQHHASTVQTRNRAERLLAELGSRLPPEAIAAAQERSKDKKLEEVVDGVLEEIRDS
jgi:predicted ATPase/DNA-binding SARP family transcriptional activator